MDSIKDVVRSSMKDSEFDKTPEDEDNRPKTHNDKDF